MAVRERGLYNHHLSDIRYADALPVGSIVGVYVDKASAQGDDHIALTSSSSNKVADNYPGYLYCVGQSLSCLLYTSPSPRDKRQSRMPSSA